MFLDFRKGNGFVAFLDGVCCIYENESAFKRRFTDPVKSQCHSAFTQQKFPVSLSLTDLVTRAVFISKSCSSGVGDSDVCPP